MDRWVKPIRTSLQVLIALVPAVPVLVPALGLSATVGVGAGLIAIASALSHLMQNDAVEQLLEKLNLKSPEK